MTNDKNRVYFTGLDSLRAIGALSVVLGHIELSKNTFGISNLMSLSFYKNTSGHLGVMLFFVLSGFLITYLLLQEKQKYNSIYVKNFYVRRALRIWPIYYLIVTLLVFVMPYIISLEYFSKPNLSDWGATWPTIAIYFLMVPNFVSFGIAGLGGGFQLGSIGTEEQFYIIWPWLMKWFKNILIPLFIILVSIPLAPHVIDYCCVHFFNDNLPVYTFLKQLGNFFTFFKINCMALGGLFAWIYFKDKTRLLNIFYSVPVQVVSILVGLGGWLVGFHLPMFNDEFYSLFFAIIILNTATNKNKILSFDYKITNYLGKISYGIYVYHWIVIYLVMDILKSYTNKPVLYNIALYFCALSITVVIAHLSYYYFELYFLRFKDKFAKIKSYQKV